ncbi:SDR family oxidoreductase [Bacillus suaedaesalsae]|uniref:SDR family oxidoreductase n=1 Tax=Bacillus suaedaesalsae TaxID=2810349 RepID=A0ABS2DHL6_9BACI|nr:SDR family oxidoreductase [Bacillus suaedaesalsae]MBM6617975.1 SDR family oxidoreductase [Bacillus suaedaesalsae]
MKVEKKIAIVTGACCGKGIGAAICRKLASQGVHIFFTHFQSEERWPSTFKEELRGYGVSCKGFDIDLSDHTASRLVIEACTSQLGVPTILVNNAAYSMRDGYGQLDAQTIDAHYTVNMRSAMLLSVEFVRKFEKTNLKNGRIINMISGQELGPMLEELAYVATKGAITAFTKTLSAEVAHLGITVNAVNPGATDTTWMNDEIREHLLPKFPTGRIGQPEDAAKLIAFLASNESEWITGQVIHSEGGFLRS